jgi:hypothetical protein
MKRLALTTTILAALGAVVAIPVLADSDHGSGQARRGDNAGGFHHSASEGGTGDHMSGMMEMMHSGRGGMMGGGMMGGGMMGGAGHLQELFDADEDGNVTPEELRTGLLESLGTYDADGNGSLSLEEFETMHSAHIRETTVDRFQAFDADGDGQISDEEMVAPADQMRRMMAVRNSGQQQGMPMNDGDDNGMMNDN